LRSPTADTFTVRAILYDKTCNCPSSELARRALTQARVDFESRPLDANPIDRDGALGLARGARRFLVKTGTGFVQHDAAREPVSEAQALEWLLHEDGFLRVPVLVWGDMLVRGFSDELYERALAELPTPEGERR
jgi:arsenate reductase-like glutaredoxin family protein